MSTLTLTPFTPAHIPGATRLSREAGWPHRAEDWALVSGLSEGVVILDGAEVMGTALCTSFGDRASLNSIIVDERLRGQGWGRRLMTAVMDLAGPREMVLIATEQGQPLYEKLGFVAYGQILQHQGMLREVPQPDAAIRCGSAADLDRICADDQAAYGMDRRALLQSLVAEDDLFLADQGFAFSRRFGRGRVVGPVVAADAATAGALIRTALAAHPGAFQRVDTKPECGLADWLVTLDLTSVGGGTAMRRAAATTPSLTGAGTPATPAAASRLKTFALAAQALG
jgi:GNAT superfamily N-acetyltransferase